VPSIKVGVFVGKTRKTAKKRRGSTSRDRLPETPESRAWNTDENRASEDGGNRQTVSSSRRHAADFFRRGSKNLPNEWFAFSLLYPSGLWSNRLGRDTSTFREFSKRWGKEWWGGALT